MTQQTVLVIDDSATIRRLVDTHLSQAGYRVVLAPTAEEGVQLADEIRPELILLDHQLPGTTGFQVCQQLLADAELGRIPVVVSSTLRKQAYAEYTDSPNVVDMLPKPFAPELLLSTVANVLETGRLIVDSQSSGSAVPEVIQELAETALSGSLECFSLREVLDFLNNGTKSGLLEVELEQQRVRFYLGRGRIQAVTASGIEAGQITDRLPEPLQDLAPVVSFTLGGRFSSEVDGLVQLLDKKVIDQRLLRQLLRHQAAWLTHFCFRNRLKSFRFEANASLPPLFQKLALDISLVALLIDGALYATGEETPAESSQTVYARSAIRGQNLDRAGMNARHMKVLGHLSRPLAAAELSRRCGCPEEEMRRVLQGLTLAGLIERREQSGKTVIALEHDPDGAQILRQVLAEGKREFAGRVVRDRLGFKLLMKRAVPDAVLIAADIPDFRETARQLKQLAADSGPLCWIAIVPGQTGNEEGGKEQTALHSALHSVFDAVLQRPYTTADVVRVLQDAKSKSPAGGEKTAEINSSPELDEPSSAVQETDNRESDEKLAVTSG